MESPTTDAFDGDQLIDFDEVMGMDIAPTTVEINKDVDGEPAEGTLGGRQVSATTQQSSSESTSSGPVPFLTGRLPLRLYLTCDNQAFSKYQVLVRQHIEFFESREEDLGVVQGRNKPIQLGQGKRVQKPETSDLTTFSL
jgi:hypothetical protein